MTDFSEVDKLGYWYKSVNFRAIETLLAQILASVLAQILEAWEPAAGEATLRLAIETVDNLSLQEVTAFS